MEKIQTHGILWLVEHKIDYKKVEQKILIFTESDT